MESLPQFLPILGLLLFALIHLYKRTKRITAIPPHPSGSLPFIGHLHLLRGQPPVAILAKLADDYGPIYSLRLGCQPALVVSSWQMVKECLTTNDRIFATRPNTAFSRHMLYDRAGFALAPYGPYWRHIRKLATSELFTGHGLQKLKNVCNSEVTSFINELFLISNRDPRAVIDMGKWFQNVSFNIIARILGGKRFSYECDVNNEYWHVKEVKKKGLNFSGVFVVSDFIPNIEWMDVGGHLKDMKKVAKEVDGVLEKWVQEHVEKREKHFDGDKEGDFMDVMISTLSKDDEMFAHGRETIIKATTLVDSDDDRIRRYCFDIDMGTLFTANNPYILEAAQKELDVHVGRSKWVQESDLKGLTYPQAIVKETLRLYPPGALAAPHEAIEDCYIGGCHVSKGTRLIMNIWKLHRDPQVWLDPYKFRPERFLEEHADKNYQGQNFEYIPFSSGRRMCPAVTHTLQVVHLTLARLLQGFDLSSPMGEPVDMSETLGIALAKIKPLEVIITPRLSQVLC